MEIIGYFSMILIGITLGLLGAGGSILTLPVMVYFFRLETGISIRYSLFVVGMTSMFATIPKLKKKEVLLKKGLLFGAISVNVVWMVRTYFLPLIPKSINLTSGFSISYGTVTMVLFSLLMILASRPMIRGRKNASHMFPKSGLSAKWVILCAIATGLLTGTLGAGGGFLIVPALVLFFGIDTKMAIGTSLLIISVNALGGFLSDLAANLDNDWLFLSKITLLSFLGSFIGEAMSGQLDKEKLRCSFGWFILALAVIILSVQLSTFSNAQPRKQKLVYQKHNQ